MDPKLILAPFLGQMGFFRTLHNDHYDDPAIPDLMGKKAGTFRIINPDAKIKQKIAIIGNSFGKFHMPLFFISQFSEVFFVHNISQEFLIEKYGISHIYDISTR